MSYKHAIGVLALWASSILVGCDDEEAAQCPSNGVFTASPKGRYCSYPQGIERCPTAFPYDYRAESGGVICGSEEVPLTELPVRTCRAAGETRCDAFWLGSLHDASTTEDADTPDDAGEPEDDGALLDATSSDAAFDMDAESDGGEEPEPDAALEIDGQAPDDSAAPPDDGSTDPDGTLLMDSSVDPDGTLLMDSSVDPDDTSIEDGSAPSDDGSTVEPPAPQVLYEADFTTGPQGWEGTGAWEHGPAFDDIAWTRQEVVLGTSSMLVSPTIDLSAATADPTIELDIRYFGEFRAIDVPDYEPLRTRFLVSYGGGPWEPLAPNEWGVSAIHWAPWHCADYLHSPGPCIPSWRRAAATLPRHPTLSDVRLAFFTGQPLELSPDLTVSFAVRRVSVHVDPKRHVARGAAFSVECPNTGEPPTGPLPVESAAVTFAVEPGATIRRFSLSALIAHSGHTYRDSLYTRGRIIFPDGSHHEIEWQDHDADWPDKRYDFDFASGPPVGSSAVGEFRLELETTSTERCTGTVYPWFAELIVD